MDLSKYGKHALVLGAAEGLGKAYSQILSNHKKRLSLYDYQEDKLIILSQYLEQLNGIPVKTTIADLSSKENWPNVIDDIIEDEIGLVVFNAAFGPVKMFEEMSDEDIDKIIFLNCQSIIRIIHGILKARNTRQSLGIVIVSSLSAYYGTQYVVSYAASKAFLKNLAEGLFYEYKDSNVDVIAVCPGLIDTPGLRLSNPDLTKISIKLQNPHSVAIASLKALGKKPVEITGRMNRLSYFVLNRLISTNAAGRILNAIMNKIYGNRQQDSKRV